MKYILYSTIFSTLLFSWELSGTGGDVDISKGDIKDNVIWAYQEGEWKTTIDTPLVKKLTSLKGGEGFWIKNRQTLPNLKKSDSYSWKEGWNLVSPVFRKWNLKEKFKSSLPFAWKYNSKDRWMVYFDKDVKGFKKFESVSVGEGVWIYLPKMDIKLDNQPLLCENGSCYDIDTTSGKYKIYLKTKSFNKELMFGFDLYRYSNKKHYKLAFGPFSISKNGVNSSKILTCVEKELDSGSCKNIDNNKEKFLSYSEGKLIIDSQKIASVFDKTIPHTKESFDMKIYISGFDDVKNFKNDADFETFLVTIKNSKSVKFKVTIR